MSRLEAIITEQYPPTNVRDVEEVIFVDDGPVDYLAWFALEGYEDHTFFYYDDAPEEEMLRQLLGMMPRESEMPKFRALLRAKYETFEVVESPGGLANRPRQPTRRHTFSNRERRNRIAEHRRGVFDIIVRRLSCSIVSPTSKASKYLPDLVRGWFRVSSKGGPF